VKIDSKPFHPDTYVGPEQEDDDAVQQAVTLREKSMTIKLKVENTIRWRWIKDEFGNDVSFFFSSSVLKILSPYSQSAGNLTVA
jgi:hypothetical protein